MKILFGGDVAFGRVAGESKEVTQYGYSKCLSEFSSIERDYAIVNLESPICEGGKTELVTDYDTFGQRYYLCSDKNAPSYLREGRVDHVTRANNHCLDFGLQGIIETSSRLDSYGISWSGLKEPHIDHEKKIVVFSSVFIGNYDRKYATLNNEFEEMFVGLRKELSDYLFFVCPHWGLEWYREPLPSHKTLALRWIDLGADGVFGNHPHVPQNYMIYKNKPVFFSLGNLFFPHKGKKRNLTATQWSLAPLVEYKGRELISVKVHRLVNASKPSIKKGKAKVIEVLTKKDSVHLDGIRVPQKSPLNPMPLVETFCREQGIHFKSKESELVFKDNYRLFYSTRGLTLWRGGEVKAHFVSKCLEDFYFILKNEVKS